MRNPLLVRSLLCEHSSRRRYFFWAQQQQRFYCSLMTRRLQSLSSIYDDGGDGDRRNNVGRLFRLPPYVVDSTQRIFSCRTFTTTTTKTATTTIPTKDDAKELLQLMNNRPGSLLQDASDCQRYNQDWTKQYQGNSSIVVRPNSTKEVSSILNYCNQRHIPIVPQGGNTGLVGGSIPVDTEVVLSLEQMNQIESFENGVLKCESGCIIQALQEELETSHNSLLPIDLGSKGTCQIGGTVSTNAGGSYYYRYESFHANIIGLEVVLPDSGNVLDLGYTNCHLKDNTGYFLKNLFIGAEGTLGIVTKVAMKCPQYPNSKHAAFLACNSFADVQSTLRHAKSQLGEILAAFEYMDDSILNLVATSERGKTLKMPFGQQSYPYCILIETHGSDDNHDLEKIQSFLETVMDEEIVVDGILSQSLSDLNAMWAVRESCNPVFASNGYVYKYDLSLSVTDFPVFIDNVRKQLPSSAKAVNGNWGHIVDGNLHFNVVLPGKFEKDIEFYHQLEQLVLDEVIKLHGSISAEHGLGQYKHKHMSKIKDETTLTTMRSIKELFDPKGIMNPGKYLPSP